MTMSASLTQDLSKNESENGDQDMAREEHGNTSSLILESRFRSLREESTNLSQALTQKLATSQSGQNLLHIGPALSTLPPDLQSLLSNLEPFHSEIESFEKKTLEELKRIVECGFHIRIQTRRVQHANACTELYQDLVASERDIQRDGNLRVTDQLKMVAKFETKKSQPSLSDESDIGALNDIDHIASLERAAHTTLQLIHELKSSNDAMFDPKGSEIDGSHDGRTKKTENSKELPSMNTPLPTDKEKARFLMKLAPRIRRLESDTVKALTARLDMILTDMLMKSKRNETFQFISEEEKMHYGRLLNNMDHNNHPKMQDQTDNLKIGHCLRGLAILGRGKQAESTFARVASMPIVRSKISLGRLDEGGSRGECTGLFSLMDDIAHSIRDVYGEVLRMSEGIFNMSDLETSDQIKDGNFSKSEIDLVTAGVWVPIATSLISDPSLKMAIFSPGIASILQANYTALETFLSEIATILLTEVGKTDRVDDLKTAVDDASFLDENGFASLYVKPKLTNVVIEKTQARIYEHQMTKDFFKKWNLPIYYQLRFGELCSRLNHALARVQENGWETDVFSALDSKSKDIYKSKGFELPCFMELYDMMLWLWKSDVLLKPLTHRFLRATIQLIGRMMTFIDRGVNGEVKFGNIETIKSDIPVDNTNANSAIESKEEVITIDNTYNWGERIEHVAAVCWDLSILETCINHDYLDTIKLAVAPENHLDKKSLLIQNKELEEVRELVAEVLGESSQDISPLITKYWNETIVGILIRKCSGPLSAVKGVAATYRMTNRPPPTMASPFVSTILRPLQEFVQSISMKTPPQIGNDWPLFVIDAVALKYSSSVEELIETVQRTEEALKNRKSRRTAAGGMSDGEKVKLQLFLDYREFRKNVELIGVDADNVVGVRKLCDLTRNAESLFLQNQK